MFKYFFKRFLKKKVSSYSKKIKINLFLNKTRLFTIFNKFKKISKFKKKYNFFSAGNIAIFLSAFRKNLFFKKNIFSSCYLKKRNDNFLQKKYTYLNSLCSLKKLPKYLFHKKNNLTLSYFFIKNKIILKKLFLNFKKTRNLQHFFKNFSPFLNFFLIKKNIKFFNFFYKILFNIRKQNYGIYTYPFNSIFKNSFRYFFKKKTKKK